MSGVLFLYVQHGPLEAFSFLAARKDARDILEERHTIPQPQRIDDDKSDTADTGAEYE